MALKRLTAEEMLQVSAGWLDPGSKGSKAILACPETAPLMPRLKRAHQALASSAQPENPSGRLAEISVEEEGRDLRHDELIRGSFMFLTGASYLLGMGGAGAKLIELRDTLQPDGLESVNKTYRAESGQAAQLAGRIAPLVPALESLVVGPKTEGKSLKTFTDEWVELGKRLGELEDEKGRLQATPPDATAAAQLSARNVWIRVGNALLANAEMAELDADTMAEIFGPMWAAERSADRRGTKKVKPEVAPPTETGTNLPV